MALRASAKEQNLSGGLSSYIPVDAGGGGDPQTTVDEDLHAEWTDPELMDLVDEQLYLNPVGVEPGMSVSLLTGTEPSANARGMIVVPPTGGAALLAVLHLPQLPPDQVWLIRRGGMHSAGMFSVDSTGYGQIRLELIAPLVDLEAILITIERAGGSPGPTGRRVLRGDL